MLDEKEKGFENFKKLYHCNQDMDEKELYDKYSELWDLRKQTLTRINAIRQSNPEMIKYLNEYEHDLFNEDNIKNFSNKMANYTPDERKKEINHHINRMGRVERQLGFYNRFVDALNKDVDIDPGRLLGLTDGIFGMVITLLVFGVGLPEITLDSNLSVLSFIQSLLPTVGTVLVSFILVSSFWIYHHEFIKIKNLNLPYLWLNIIYLACISFIPFTTSLIGEYGQYFYAELTFGVNIFLTIVTFMLMFHYAYHHNFLEHEVNESEKGYILHTFFTIMFFTICVMIGDVLISPKCTYLFFLTPIISTLRDVNFRKLI